MKNLLVSLPEDLYHRLVDLSREFGHPPTSMVREAIGDWVVRTERKRVSEEIASYAASEAGGEHDLDENLEQAAAEEFCRGDEE